MANVEVTGLKLSVSAGLSDTKRKLDTLKTSLTKLKIPDSKVKAINDLATGVSKFATAINKLDVDKINSFGTALKGLGEVQISKATINRVNELGDAFKNVDVKALGASAEKLNAALAPLADTMSKISTSAKELGINGKFGQAVAKAEDAYNKVSKDISEKGQKEEPTEQQKSIEKFREDAKATAQQIDTIFGGTKIGQAYGALQNFRQAVSILKEELANTNAGKFFLEIKARAEKTFQSVVDGAKKALSVLKKFSSIAVNVVKTLPRIGALNPFKGLGDSISKTIGKLKNLGSSLARIAMYRALRTAIKEIVKAIREGLSNLYQWSKITGGDFAPAVDKIATAMLYLKNSFGAAASPLITYFAPAIDIATDKLVSLLNVINQIFARLTGRATWTRALKYPTEFAESAAGATKKVKDNIQDFDELHILRTDNGGSGKKAEDYSKMFEETEFSQGLTDWIQSFKDAIKNGRWYEAGNILANEINNIINKVDWKKLGINLGDKITNMFQFAFGLLKNIDFVNIGSSAATFLNNAIDHIDANLVGQTFARKWTMIIDTLYGFVTTFDFPQFGWKISEFVQGWFEELDGARLGYTISEAIKGALDSAIAFMSNDDMWNKFAEDIGDIINNIDWYGILVRVLNLGAKIISAIGQVISVAISGGSGASGQGAIVSDMSRVYASAPEAIAQRVQNSFDTQNSSFGDRLVTGLSNSIDRANSAPLSAAFMRLINAALEAVWKLFKTLAEKIVGWFAERLDDAITGAHWDEMGNRVEATNSGDAWLNNRDPGQDATTREVVENVGFMDLFREGATNLIELGTTGGSVFDLLTGGYQSYGKLAVRTQKTIQTTTVNSNNAITKSYNKMFDSVNKGYVLQKNGFNSLATTVNSGSKSMTEDMTSFADKMNGDVVSKIMQSKNAISATITSLSEDTKFRMSDMTNTVISSIDNADKAIVTPMANIKNTITNGFKEAGTESIKAITEMGSKMSGALDGAISASKDSVSGYKGVWDGLKGSVKDTSNSVIAGSESMANGVTTAFNGIIKNLKNFRVKIPDIGDNKDAGKEFDFSHLKELEKVSIPRLAKGGIISSPTTALIGEAGKEAVVPLENNTGWIDNLADKLSGDGEEIALLREEVNLLRTIAGKSFTISSREVFNAVREENADYITMTGKNALVM